MFNARLSSASPPFRSIPGTQNHPSVQSPTQRTTSLSQGPSGPGNVNPNRSSGARLARSITDDNAFGRQLDEWVAAGGPDERRKDAAARIRTCKKSNCRMLNITSSNLRSLPTCVVSLSKLQDFTLSFNCLEALPDGFDKLTTLENLNLEGNKLVSLPDRFDQLTALKILNLKGNNLETLPDGFDQLTALKSLNLKGNNLKTLPDGFDKFKALWSLALSNNKLKTLPDGLGKLTQLGVLELDNNNLKMLPNWFDKLMKLCSLTLHGNPLKTLPHGFGKLTSLTTLSVTPEIFSGKEDSGLVKEVLDPDECRIQATGRFLELCNADDAERAAALARTAPANSI